MINFSLIFFILTCLSGSALAKDVTGPLTKDFQTWLNSHGYKAYDFVRGDYGTQGSFGGKTPEASEAIQTPVIFIHGNSDSALKRSSSATGWSNSIQYFMKNGYTVAELYATSWQDTNSLNAGKRTHNCKDLIRLRKFLEAVLAYTGAGKVSVVSHSMGVTLARKIVKGGAVKASDGRCDLGGAISDKIEVMVGISGANYGLCNCASALFQKTCNKENGFYPGSCGSNTFGCGLMKLPCNSTTYSSYLMDLNNDPRKEGEKVFSMWSSVDDLIGYGDLVWGRPTSLIPTSDDSIVYPSYTHMQTKEKTFEDQFQLVKYKKVLRK